MRKVDAYLILSFLILQAIAMYTVYSTANFKHTTSVADYIEGSNLMYQASDNPNDGEAAESYALTYCKERAEEFFKHKGNNK